MTGNQFEKNLAIQKIDVGFMGTGEYKLSFNLLNHGVNKIDVARVLISYYDFNDNLVWVDQKFVDTSLFSYDIKRVNVLIPSREHFKIKQISREITVNGTVTNGQTESQSNKAVITLPSRTGFKYASIKVDYMRSVE